jgi:predicted secreted protein with PEFG-CTERM motif
MSTSIIDVSNPPAPANVIVQMTTRFKNGTETTQRGTTDVESGIGNMTNWVVAADLNPNDAVYTEDIYSTWLINETIVRTYPSGTRNTNHFNTSTESNMTGFYQYYSQNFYWDKSTGIMVEMSFSQITQTSVSQTIMSGKITMSESSVWVVPEFPTWTLILLILIVLTIAIATKKYRERQFGPRYNPETQVKPQ